MTDIPPDLEARFMEQEHRIVRVVQNFFDRKRWPEDDPRRHAARNAVLWRLLAPGAAAVAAGGLVALATLGVLVWQTRLIAEQNEFFKEQNQKLQTQIDQQADQDTNRRRTEIIATLYETQPGPDGVLVPRANPRTRAEAVAEFMQLERRRLERQQKQQATQPQSPSASAARPAYQTGLSLTQARLDGLNLDGMDFNGLSLVGAFLQNTSFAGAQLRNVDLRAAMLESTSLRGADLRSANFEGSNLLQVSLARADLRGARLVSVGVKGCEFLGADLRGADLTGLREASTAGWRGANIAGMQGLTLGLRQQLLELGALELADDAAWAQQQQGMHAGTPAAPAPTR